MHKKVQERKLELYGHAGTDKIYVGGRVMEKVQVRGGRGRLKRRWMDYVRETKRENSCQRKTYMVELREESCQKHRSHNEVGKVV